MSILQPWLEQKGGKWVSLKLNKIPKKRRKEKNDKVNSADSAFILVRKIARMILIQNIQGLIGPLMINMAFMPLYM